VAPSPPALRSDHINILTGSVPGDGHPSGRKMLDDFVASHSWIGERQFGGSAAIPIRRPFDTLAKGRIVAGLPGAWVWNHTTTIGREDLGNEHCQWQWRAWLREGVPTHLGRAFRKLRRISDILSAIFLRRSRKAHGGWHYDSRNLANGTRAEAPECADAVPVEGLRTWPFAAARFGGAAAHGCCRDAHCAAAVPGLPRCGANATNVGAQCCSG
jgi:hypothetical protein